MRPLLGDTLPRRMITAMVLYLVVLTLVLSAFTVISNERAEKFGWRAILTNAMTAWDGSDQVDSTKIVSPIRRFDNSTSSIPVEFSGLSDGLHDDILLNGKVYAVLLTTTRDGHRRAVAVDASSIEKKEHVLVTQVLSVIVATMVLAGLLGAWSLKRALRPLSDVVREISLLDPEVSDVRLVPPADATHEVRTLAGAVNGYSGRIGDYVRRERAFVEMASHELRTPVAVLSNELELMQDEAQRDHREVPRLQRARRTTQDLQSLLEILLLLARNPERLQKQSSQVDPVAIAQKQIQLHQALLQHKQLQIVQSGGNQGNLLAPPVLVEVIVANLLRNAIENSDHGTIEVHWDRDGTLTVTDPGSTMSAQEVSELYRRVLRGDSMHSAGIGMQLLSRIVEHMGWRLDYSEVAAGRTQARVQFPQSAPIGLA
ncbi:ATP-binding protein [Luteimonas sp. FXH3W]|uniref:histidine kinase n=1 Tax=Aquilutibacter rugosus TaxID=3115820 RepID=A0ABU7V021_9GAMM